MPKSASAALTLARVLLTFSRLETGIAKVCVPWLRPTPGGGGIFDYWGVPAGLASAVFADVQGLVDGHAA